MTEIITDLHAHGCSYMEKGKGQFIVELLGEGGERTAKSFIQACERKFPLQSTLLGIVSFYDNTYGEVLKTLREVRGDVYDDYKDSFFGVKRNNMWRYFIRVQEVPTDEGHLLLIGAERFAKSKQADFVLNEAKNETDAVTIPSHILSKGPSGFLNFLARGKKLSFGREGLEKYRDYLDAIEAGNSNFPSLTEDSEALARELHIPTTYDSDSHTPENFFSSYMALFGMDFSNQDKFRKSLRQSIKNCKREDKHLGSNGKLGKYKHILVSVFDNEIRIPFGLLKPKNLISYI